MDETHVTFQSQHNDKAKQHGGKLLLVLLLNVKINK